ncbi:MAG: nitronate monooxygenase [Ignavibacteria bacterium]|nr:nitronate monooxygenase [Ignavibacteria bacterium]
MELPLIIQGGMGIAISDWRLASAVSRAGQLGVISGTAISRIFTSRLMNGDISGNIRRALSNFPITNAVERILDRYFIPGGKPRSMPYRSQPVHTLKPSRLLDQLTAIANYVEIFLAKENHSGIIGINLLEKLQMSNLASLYGAMLAGVDYVLMGAGIPIQIAAVLDKLSGHEAVNYRLDVQDSAPDDSYRMHFDPEKIFPGISKLAGLLKRPKFLPVVSSTVLAHALIKRSEGAINGFIVEGATAGGHNAPPRGIMKLSSTFEPVYSDKDTVDLEKMKMFGLPFWLAGGYGHPDKLIAALDAGATGIQVGTAFSLCDESGMASELKIKMLKKVLDKSTSVFTNPTISPTGFPFKVASIEKTMSEQDVYESRRRICDLGYLRTIFKDKNGYINYRCPGEPVEDYLRKCGKLEDTIGRTCLCNNLIAAAGYPQSRTDGYIEPPLVTSGVDLPTIRELISTDKMHYSARDVINFLLSPVNS